MKTKSNKSDREGAILPIIMVIMVVLTILVMSLFNMAAHGARETEYSLNSAQAFWLAEAGLQQCVSDLYNGGDGIFKTNTMVSANIPGTFRVEEDASDPTKRIAIGTVTVGGKTITRKVQLEVAFIVAAYEDVIFGGNDNTTNEWTLRLSGTGTAGANPPSSGSGGPDTLLGDVTVIGANVMLDEDSSVMVPTPNNYGVKGDVTASGSILDPGNDDIAGDAFPNTSGDEAPDLSKMKYADNNDWDIAFEFETAGITSGYLPEDHPLHDVVVKNPSNRSEENASTDGDDFYFEPSSVRGSGSKTTGETPLILGDDKVYYVDGHVWFHNKTTYGFEVDGQAAIVATRDIHISDNLQYKNNTREAVAGNEPDLLALVALGQYTGDTRSGYGNVYFGDPRYGTLYTADAFMFANNNFYYNTDSTTDRQQEPETGFKVFGNFMAVNQVVVLRDWYSVDLDTGTYKYTYYRRGRRRTSTKTAEYRNGAWYDTESGDRVTSSVTPDTRDRAAVYDPKTSEWKDAITGAILSSTQEGTLEHYAMKVGYDDRIRDAGTQMKGLPLGQGSIFAGIKGWTEVATN